MSKAIAAALVVLGGGTATAAVIYVPKFLNREDLDLPSSLTDFKSKGHEKGCLPALFAGLGAIPEPTTGTSETLDSNFFGTDKTKTKGCLVVNWDKENHSSNKWKGNVRFLWAAKGENGKGFIVFLVGKTPTSGTEKELKWEGSAYSLAQEEAEGNKTWKVKKKSDVGSDKKFVKGSGSSDTEQKKKFPQPGEALKRGNPSAAIADYWGFFTGSGDLDNICISDCAGQPSKESFVGHWSWEGSASETKKLLDWTKDFETWWNDVYGNDQFKLKDAADNITGKWTEKTFRRVPEKATAE